MLRKSLVKMFVVLFVVLGALGSAVGQMPNPYGLPISLENAKKAAVPALAEAAKNNWAMAVAIVGPAGNLIYYEKMDNTQLGSAEVAIDKARTAALFKRPTRAFQDVVAAGGEGLRVLSLKGVVAVEGGISAGHGRKDCGSHRSFRRDERAGRAVRESGRGHREVGSVDDSAWLKDSLSIAGIKRGRQRREFARGDCGAWRRSGARHAGVVVL